MKQLALAIILVCGGPAAHSQAAATATAESFMAQAKAAAGSQWSRLYRSLCESPASGPSTTSTRRPGVAPQRERWLTEPMQIFDTLYFVGTRDHSSWAVVTSAGIILIDTLYEYATEDAIIGGMAKLGLDPKQIKYLIVSHGHSDHVGGAGLIQQRYNPRVIMGGPDWDSVQASPRIPNKPRRDIVASDGQKVTLGDTTVTVHLTPGHTPGTLAFLFPVKDGDSTHTVAYWGGTGFNFSQSRAAFQTYVESARRFGELAGAARADVLLSNHTSLDGSTTKMSQLKKRAVGAPHPYVVGQDSVSRYLQVAQNCAGMMLLRQVK